MTATADPAQTSVGVSAAGVPAAVVAAGFVPAASVVAGFVPAAGVPTSAVPAAGVPTAAVPVSTVTGSVPPDVLTAPAAPAEAIDAATLVVLRDAGAGPEVLLLRRSPASPHFPGAWVFPGGKVLRAEGQPDEQATAAAVREAREEAGLDLPADGLVLWSVWAPPAHARAQFRTAVFCTALASTADVVVDGYEAVEAEWVAPTEALRRHAEQGWELLPPTWVTLHGLAGWASVDAILAAGVGRRPPQYRTQVLGRDPTVLGWAGDELYPGEPGVAGRRHRLSLGDRPWRFEWTPGVVTRDI